MLSHLDYINSCATSLPNHTSFDKHILQTVTPKLSLSLSIWSTETLIVFVISNFAKPLCVLQGTQNILGPPELDR